MRVAVVRMMLVALLGFASDRSYGQPNPFQQQQPRRTLDNLLGEPAEKAPLAPPAKEAVASVDLLAVPPEAEVAEAIILIRDAYADEYKGEPGALITTLKSAAFQTDDAVRKFALLQEAEKAAVKAGDPSKAFELLEKRGGLFEIDVQQSSIALLKKFPKLPGQTTKKLIEISLQISRTALGADQFPTAKDAVEVAVGKARDLSQEERDKKIKGLGGANLLKEALALQLEISQRSKIFDDYEKAVATLKKAGAGACEREHDVVGRYLCLAKDDWDAGVVYLAKGESGPLQVAASKELEMSQKAGAKKLPTDVLAMAGDWWKLSEKSDRAKLSECDLLRIREHAASLYAKALPNLADPTDLTLANKRSVGAKPAGNAGSRKKVVLIDVPKMKSFVYGFKHVNQADADRYLIDSTGMRKYSEWQSSAITYWGHSANGVEGRLVYKFDFAAPTSSIRLKADSPTWDYTRKPGGVGRGASSLEVSRSGVTWISLRNNLEPRNWGGDWTINDQLPAAAIGGTSLWVRMRFYTENAPNSEYTNAQFGRSTSAATGNVFELSATY